MVESMCKKEGPSSLMTTRMGPTNNNDARETESLIRSAFEELDRERQRRLELEAELAQLKKEQQPQPSTPPSKKPPKSSRRRSSKSSPADNVSAMIPPKHYTALQQELEGYRQIVHAMTQEKPAIAAALEANDDRRSSVRTGRRQPVPIAANSMPLHVIRLLEIMPWEPKAQEHAFRTEEIYEWQIYSNAHGWNPALAAFPSFFQALPVHHHHNSNDSNNHNKVQEYQPLDSLRLPGRDRSMLMFLAGCETMGSATSTASPTGVLTNAGLTHLLDLSQGFPLSVDGGTWQWVGGWRIEKRVIVFATGNDSDERPQTFLDCDEEGWSYAMDASDFLKDSCEQHCLDSPGRVQDKLTMETSPQGEHKVVQHCSPLRKVRRRKWTRRRVLVDYPHASEQSKHFLKLLAQNASLTFCANKISDQLVETKMKLTDAQVKTFQTEEETKFKVAQLRQEIQIKEDVIAKLKQKKAEKKKKKQTPSEQQKQEEEAKPLERQDSVEKIVPEEEEEEEEPVKPEVKKPHSSSKDLEKKGNNPLEMVSQWVSSRHIKVINSNDGHSSDSENPTASDASATSATVPEDEDESLEGTLTASRRNSTSSQGSHQPISFDWKKIGRDTIEKIKQLNNPNNNKADNCSQNSDNSVRSTTPTQEEEEFTTTTTTVPAEPQLVAAAT